MDFFEGYFQIQADTPSPEIVNSKGRINQNIFFYNKPWCSGYLNIRFAMLNGLSFQREGSFSYACIQISQNLI